MAAIGHIEIAGTDGRALASFYSDLFGWNVECADPDAQYPYFSLPGGEAFSTGIRHEPEGCAEIVIYVAVDDVDTSFARAIELGAGERIAPMTHGDMKFALVTDPQGNPIGLTQKPSDG